MRGLALGTIFLLQATALLIPSEPLYYLAYPVLGQWPEGWLPDLVILWFVAMLLIDSRGKSRILGLVAISPAVCLELYCHVSAFLGTLLSAEAGILKLLLLLPFVWLIFESAKKRPEGGFVVHPYHRCSGANVGVVEVEYGLLKAGGRRHTV